jgi:hypothetical protein
MFTCHKILLHGPTALLPLRRIVYCGFLGSYIALKNPSPWPNLNPQSLNPMTNMLTITSPWRLLYGVDWEIMMGWDCLRTATTGLFFIPRVICEHGELWWLWWWCWLGITPDLSTRALCQSYQQRHLGQLGEMDKGVRILFISVWNTSRDLQHAVKSYDMRPPALFSIRIKVCCGFLSFLKIHRLGRVWTRDTEVQWQAC